MSDLVKSAKLKETVARETVDMMFSSQLRIKIDAEVAHHFRESSPRDPSQKCEDISPGPAAETVKNLSGWADRERRSLFKMERT